MEAPPCPGFVEVVTRTLRPEERSVKGMARLPLRMRSQAAGREATIRDGRHSTRFVLEYDTLRLELALGVPPPGAGKSRLASSVAECRGIRAGARRASPVWLIPGIKTSDFPCSTRGEQNVGRARASIVSAKSAQGTTSNGSEKWARNPQVAQDSTIEKSTTPAVWGSWLSLMPRRPIVWWSKPWSAWAD